jgi:uncharacterized protein YpuA (DUF1002 family)
MNAQELFGSYNVLQYALCFQAGNHLINWESANKRVATEDEIKLVCKSVLSQKNINPTDDIVHILHLAVIGFSSSDKGVEFCKNYAQRPNQQFGNDDALAVKKICEDFMSEFMSKQ